MNDTDIIKEFQGGYRWLSNFAAVPIVLRGVKYPSVEHAYMSEKADLPEWKKFCSDPTNYAGAIKRKSRSVPLVSNWEEIKIPIMRECVYQKFTQEPFRTKLIATGTRHIQEGNTWGDKFWGVNLLTGAGRNELGKLIMAERERLLNDIP